LPTVAEQGLDLVSHLHGTEFLKEAGARPPFVSISATLLA
jgi:hypothetical protein